MLAWLIFAASLCAVAFVTCCCTPVCNRRCDEDWSGTSVGTDINTGSDCGWTEVAGDSEIANVIGKNLKFTTALASAQCNATSVGPHILVNAQVYTRSGATDDARVMLDFVDNDNYLACEFRFVASGVSTTSIIRRDAGAETVIKTRNMTITLTGSDTVQMCVYWDGTTLMYYCGLSTDAYGGIAHAITSETISSYEVAVGTGATVSSSVVFKRIDIWDFNSKAGTCEDCFPGSTLLTRHDTCNYFDVTFAGLGGCAGLNTTFTLALHAEPYSSPPTLPSWGLSIVPAISGFRFVGVDFVNGTGTNIDIIVTLAMGSPSFAYIEFKLTAWKTSYPTTGASAISGLSIPFNTTSGFVGCVTAGATCTITAVDPITA